MKLDLGKEYGTFWLENQLGHSLSLLDTSYVDVIAARLFI
jgi:hypothetical protein